jgi:tRNA(His) 5'-end guanylyltransferase
MKFDELDRQMRLFETAHDRYVPSEIYMIVRMDGRGFTRLTKEVHKFEAPFDKRFCDHMIETTSHVMSCGFRIIYGYTQSDEISLLFHPSEESYGRNTRKYVSVLAGEASAKFSLLLGATAVFDARVSELPTIDFVTDYFRWRGEDARRNALNAHCYWALRDQGLSAQEAADRLVGMSAALMNEFLVHVKQIKFDDLPSWQRQGVGLYWEDHEVPGVNPKTGEQAVGLRRRIKRDFDLPVKGAYNRFVQGLVEKAMLPITPWQALWGHQ